MWAWWLTRSYESSISRDRLCARSSSEKFAMEFCGSCSAGTENSQPCASHTRSRVAIAGRARLSTSAQSLYMIEALVKEPQAR